MADSVTINITVLATQTHIIGFDIHRYGVPTDHTVLPGGMLQFGGALSLDPTLFVSDSRLNGEPVKLQVSTDGTNWQDTGVTVTTGDDPMGTGWTGFFSGSYTVPAGTQPGNYMFRTHYDGNTGRGLLGCEQEAPVQVTTSAGVPSYWPLLLIAVAAVGIVGYYEYTKG
jgi:hypothetical protein